MNEIFKVVDLQMIIKKRCIFDNINFTINSGEVVGLLGHNGAGKSTIQRILANRENPTKGQIYNCGQLQSADQDFTNIVYIPDTIQLISNISINDNYELITRDRKTNDYFYNKYLEVIGLEKNEVISNLSKGNQELIQIIILLSIEADLYLLDEPFSAVDIFRRDLIQQLIIELSIHNDQAGIVITSHLINEIEPILSRVLYLDNGQIVIDSEMEDIIEQNDSLVDYLKDYFGEKVGYKNV